MALPLIGRERDETLTDRSHGDAVIREPNLTERMPLFNIAHSQRFKAA
jgi:hypothetical protein